MSGKNATCDRCGEVIQFVGSVWQTPEGGWVCPRTSLNENWGHRPASASPKASEGERETLPEQVARAMKAIDELKRSNPNLSDYDCAIHFYWLSQRQQPTAQPDAENVKCVDCRDYESNIRGWIDQLGGDSTRKHISLELERLIDGITASHLSAETTGLSWHCTNGQCDSCSHGRDTCACVHHLPNPQVRIQPGHTVLSAEDADDLEDALFKLAMNDYHGHNKWIKKAAALIDGIIRRAGPR